MWVLIWLRQYLNVIKVPIFAMIRETLVLPCFNYNLHIFSKSLTSVIRGDPKYFILFFVEATSSSPIDSTARKVVKQRNFFRNTEWMVHRRQSDSHTNSNIFCARSSLYTHHMNRWTNRVCRKMMLSEPDTIKARLIHNLDPLQGSLIYFREWYTTTRPGEKLQCANIHIYFPSISRGIYQLTYQFAEIQTYGLTKNNWNSITP